MNSSPAMNDLQKQRLRLLVANVAIAEREDERITHVFSESKWSRYVRVLAYESSHEQRVAAVRALDEFVMLL